MTFDKSVYLSSVVEDSVETLQHGLAGEVQLVEQDPVAGLHGCEEGPAPPGELSSLAALYWKVCPEQVGQVSLV